MKAEDLKAMDPFHCNLLLILDRIARSLEKLVELDEER